MSITVLRHIFGSDRGYKTLARSKEITKDEISQLENFSFGQTNSDSYLNSLLEKPAYFIRPLNANNWALTRVFKGKSDEYHRATLLFITAIIKNADWLTVLGCDIDVLLTSEELWQWDGDKIISKIEIESHNIISIPSNNTRKKVLTLLTALEKHQKEESTILINDSEFAGTDIRWLNMVLPKMAKRNFSYAVRSLSDGLSVKLICMAKEGICGNTKKSTIIWDSAKQSEYGIYAGTLAQFWKPGKEPPWQFIHSCKTFIPEGIEYPTHVNKPKMTTVPVKHTSDSKFVHRRQINYRKLMWIGISIILVVILAISIVIVFNKMKQNKMIEQLLAEGNSILNNHKQENYGFEDDTELKNRIKTIDEICGKLSVYSIKDKTVSEHIEKFKRWAGDLDHKKTHVEDITEFTLNNNISTYPERDYINKVFDSRKKLINGESDANALGEIWIKKIKNSNENIQTWIKQLEKYFNDFISKVTKDYEKIDNELKNIKPPTFYSKTNFEYYTEKKNKIMSLQKDDNLINARNSPVEDHKIRAEIFANNCDGLHDLCINELEKLKKIKEEANVAYDKAQKKLPVDPNDPNTFDLTVISDISDNLKTANKLWPDNETFQEGNEKYLAYCEKQIIRIKSSPKNMEQEQTKLLKQVQILLKHIDVNEGDPESDFTTKRKVLAKKLKSLEADMKNKASQPNNNAAK